jgi:hypothetical protein
MQIKQLGRLLRLAVDEGDAAFAASRHLRLATLDVAVLAWGRPAAWKGMLNAVLTDDQRAKKKAAFSCQFGYQLAIRTAQKLSNFSPVHSVRDRGVGGSNPLAPTNKNGQKLDEKALQLGGLFSFVGPPLRRSGDTCASVASRMFSCHFRCHLRLQMFVIDGYKIAEGWEVGRCLARR